MRVMVMIKGERADEGRVVPDEAMLTAMGAYNEQLVKAGVMLDGQGLKPSAEGAQVVFEGERTSVVDGPFTESKEIVAGTWIWQVSSLEEAVEWAKRCPSGELRQTLELRPIFEAADFGDEYTDELREHDERLGAEIRAQHPNG